MKPIIYAFGMAFALILAPIAGLAIAFATFFTCFFAFIEGVHTSMVQNLYGKIQEEEVKSENIWENHIKRMKNKKD
jgi:hypothetical protein